MTSLREQIEKTLLPGMRMPRPLELLFAWIESRNLFIDTPHGRLGFLYPDDKLREGWTETERPGGTNIAFAAEGNVNLKYWFGHARPEVLNRLCVFAKTGAEGSMAAFWLDEDGKQPIVHLGSGSGSVLVCVLAENAIDFLRLIAIGYDEICWSDAFSKPPNANWADELFIHPNLEYQNWLRETFAVSIPQTASEIVKYASDMGDAESADRFCQWVNVNSG